MLHRLFASLAVVLLLQTLQPPAARAEDVACPVEPPDDADVRRRLAWIDRHVDDVEPQVRHWFGAFVALHSVLIGVQLTLALAAPNDDERLDLIVNTVSSGLGLGTLLISIPVILGAGDFLRAQRRDTPEARVVALREAERRLQASAESSGFVRSELSVVATTLYVDAAALTLLFLGRSTGAFLHAVGGVAIGHGRLLTHPTGAIDAWRTYRTRHPEAACVPETTVAHGDSAPQLTLAPAPLRGGAGLSFTLAF